MRGFGRAGRAAAWLAAGWGLLAAAGCATRGPWCQFAISNVGENAMTDVVLQAADGQTYRSGAIPARSEANYKPTSVPAGNSATLAWKGPDGAPFSKTVAFGKPIARDFRGRIVYERDATNNVAAFLLPDLSETASPLPWGKPESWEGTVGIPGLTPDDSR